MDDNVHNTYAKELVPMAVGYSAALLNNFFRGRIEITLPPKGVYAQTENREQGFTRVTLLAKNTTPDEEEMTNGSIELVVRYKKTLNNQDPFQPYPVPTEDSFSYIVAPLLDPNINSIPRSQPIELVFDLSQNPLPVNITDLSFQVVYKGVLGQEEGAVAVGFKDVSEPTPIDIYNDMDRVCLNGSWYAAGSPEAIAQVDLDHDGIAEPGEGDVYPHDLKDLYIRFSSAASPQNASSTEYNLHIPLLVAGDYFIRRVFVLSDYEFSYGFISQVLKRDVDPFTHASYGPTIYPYKGLKNQTEPGTPERCAALNVPYPCNIRYYPDEFNLLRGQQLWEWVVFPNLSYPPGSSCPLE
ncbi:MAG: hypothetical protein HXY46_13240 [Syntrophaceae bacterium]|nr:hypothetical protein [Syntrophaceae bacterium]